MFNNKKLVSDFVLNFISSVIPVVVLQLIIFPLILGNIGSDSYGVMVTIIALINLFSFSFGNVLNNIRLLNINKKNSESNYIFFLFTISIINIIIINLILLTVYNISGLFILFSIGLVSVFLVFRQYFLVYFRLKLDYKAIFFSNLFLAVGYFIGLFIFTLSSFWSYIYLFGLSISLIYIFFKIKKYKIINFKFEDIKKIYVKEIFDNFIILIFAAFLVSSITYFDRLLLYPLMGPLFVSIYYASSIFGKMIAQIINPLSNVVLSHIANLKTFKINAFFKYFLLILSIAILMILGINMFGPFLLNLLYSDLYNEAKLYIFRGSIYAILLVLYSSLNPFILKFYKFKWQIIINLITFLIYLLLTIPLTINYGLDGFYIGIIFSLSIRVFLMIILIFNINNDLNILKEKN